MSVCLAVGSPALITYSLSLTILNRLWARQKLDELCARTRSPRFKKCPNYGDRVRAARFLLQEAQQFPMRASQDQGWLSSLIVIGDNQEWWNRLIGRLRDNRRGVTFSLVAQIVMAAVAFWFTVISALVQSIDTEEALDISAGSLWVWMVSSYEILCEQFI